MYLIASGQAGFELSVGFASNGCGAHSPGGYGLLSAMVCEVVMTMMFLLVMLGSTDKRAPQGFAPIAIGLCLTLIHKKDERYGNGFSRRERVTADGLDSIRGFAPLMAQVYSVPAAGGRSRLELPTTALEIQWDKAGKRCHPAHHANTCGGAVPQLFTGWPPVALRHGTHRQVDHHGSTAD